MKQSFLIVIFIWVLFIDLTAQNPFIKNYTISDGLPSNKILQAFQDSKGFIWFASDAGILRYDGNTFERYTTKDGLSGNFVIRLREDSFGKIWFFNMNGTVNYLYKNKIYNETNAPFLAELKSKTYMLDFYEDSDSTLYFYNPHAEVFAIKNDQLVDYTRLRVNKERDKILFYLNKTEKNHFLFWTAKGAYEYKDLNNLLLLHSSPQPILKVLRVGYNDCITVNHLGQICYYQGGKKTGENILTLESTFLNSVIKDQNGNFWYPVYDKGVFCYNKGKEILHLNIQLAQSILLDRENNIWVTTENSGIFKINTDILYSKHFDKSIFDLKGINSVTKANGGDIWITNGESVFLVKNKEIFPQKIRTKDKILNNICQLPNNDIIVNGENTYLTIIKDVEVDYTNKKIKGGKIKSLNYSFKKFAVDTSINRVFSYMNDILLYLDIETGEIVFHDIHSGRIRNVIMDRNNKLIINSSENYIATTDSINYYYPLESFDGQTILSHQILNQDSEVFNILGNNLILENKDSIYDLTKDIKSKIDYNITELAYNHDQSTLFFSTPKTIYFITNPLDIIQNKPVQLNKLNVEFNNVNDIYCLDSTLYVASDNGLTLIPIKDALNLELITPTPYFKKITINEEDYDIQNNPVEFKSKQRLSIEFASLNYSSSSSEYAYKLEGIDENWIEGTQTNVVYFNLAPGQYIFKLKSKKINEEYSQSLQLPILVQPNLIQRTSIKILIAVFLIGLIFIIIQAGYKRKFKRKEIENLMITLQHKALQSMMNPHFIFNALGSIQRYLLENKASEAGIYLSQFARLIRQNMNSLKSNSICIDDEIDRLRNYIDLEKFRMNNQFDYVINLDENIDGYDTEIPSMIVQPFVENAIWHGISSITEKGFIKINFYYLDEKSILIEIEDNGIGIKTITKKSNSKKGLNMGVSITEKRLQLIGEKYDVKSFISSNEIHPDGKLPGTRIKIITPIIPAKS